MRQQDMLGYRIVRAYIFEKAQHGVVSIFATLAPFYYPPLLMESSKRCVLGILREGKQPADLRTPLTPAHCKQLLATYPHLEIHVQEAPFRCFTAEEYEAAGASMVPAVAHADVLMGVKEVPINQLVANKPYLFFSHTIKKQPHNRRLLQKMMELNIRMIDYEMLTFDSGERVAAFGHFAGIVGAHNGLLAFGRKTDTFRLLPAHACVDYAEMVAQYAAIEWPSALRVAIAGSGRTAKGAEEVLLAAGFSKMAPADYLAGNGGNQRVFTVLGSKDLYVRLDGGPFDREGFHADPTPYGSAFLPFAEQTDILVNCVFWDVRTAPHFTLEDMKRDDFKIAVIADVSCDLNGSVPCTTRYTSIFDPVFGYDARTGAETEPFLRGTVDVVAVDNLPCELPRDASTEFGNALLEHVMPLLVDNNWEHPMINRATITKNNHLNGPFQYLRDYAEVLSY